jgi:AcrR family transcriptional regulator
MFGLARKAPVWSSHGVATSTGTPSALRREPVQARSRARVATMVTAAERLVVREGPAALTMRRLAAEAELPVGSVYQFFTDRQAVLDHLVAQHGLGQRRLLEDMLPLRGTRPWPDLVDELFDRQCARLRASPAYVAIWVARALSAEEQQRDDEDVEVLASMLAELVTAEESVDPSPALLTGCRVAVQAADALLHLAFRLDPDGDADTLAEARTMLRRYLEHVAEASRISR